jgi:hypothetical protein
LVGSALPATSHELPATGHQLPATSYQLIVPLSIHHERDNVYRFEIRGTLTKAEMDQASAAVVVEMKRVGKVRLLFVLIGFKGWEKNQAWNDLTFYVQHGDQIERIAIVGDERWKSEALMFAAADLRSAPVQFFPSRAMAEARAWLSS